MAASWQLEIARRVRGEIALDEPLAPRTSLRVGGPADLWVRPLDPADLSELLGAVRELGVPLSVLGGGANTLVADAGVRGVVLRLPPGFAGEEVQGERVVLSAGAATSRLPALSHARGLVGAEFLGGIPGTLGGATAMNAGTRLGEMKDLVERVELATADGAGWVPATALGFGYRACRLPPGAVVTRIELRLRRGDVAAGAARLREDQAQRRRTQPLDRPTFGSTFANPPGDHAGRLIEAAGLKGYRVGNATWSEVHANFVVNLGGATAADVLSLIRTARERVLERFGVRLATEVRFLGQFLATELEDAVGAGSGGS